MTCARATSVLCSFSVVRLRECGDVLRAYSPTPPARHRRDVYVCVNCTYILCAASAVRSRSILSDSSSSSRSRPASAYR